MRDYGDDVFESTALYYAKYRPKYPRQIFDDIQRKFRLDGEGRLLDLGCGTGEMAIPLSKYFDKILAIDPDRGMIHEGSKKAKKLQTRNIEWRKGSSRALRELEGSFTLVSMGQSFHWMDGVAVLKQLYGKIMHGGGVVIVGSVPMSQNELSNNKDSIIKELITKYLGPKKRAGKYFYEPTGQNWETETFPNSVFENFEKHDYVIKIKRNHDQVIGSLFSMSWASKKLLGGQAAAFENELRQKLEALNGARDFVDHVQFSMYILTKK